MTPDEEAQKLLAALVAEGRMIEAGWVGYCRKVIPRGASAVQIEETRRGFYAGAHHLFYSIVTMIESGEEATPNDLQALDNVQAELERFYQTLGKALGN